MLKDKLNQIKNKVQELPSKAKEHYKDNEHNIKPLVGLIATQVVLSIVGVAVSRGTNSLFDSFCEGLDTPDTIEVD